MYWNDHMSAGGWILAVVWTLIILALLILGIVWLVRTLTANENRSTASEAAAPSAREVLDQRLARGEVTIEQYQQLRQAMDNSTSAHNGRAASTPASTPGYRVRRVGGTARL